MMSVSPCVQLLPAVPLVRSIAIQTRLSKSCHISFTLFSEPIHYLLDGEMHARFTSLFKLPTGRAAIQPPFLSVPILKFHGRGRGNTTDRRPLFSAFACSE